MAFVTFNPQNTFWGLKRSIDIRQGRRVISTADNLVLKETDCYGGTLVLVTAAKTVTVPAIKAGMDFLVMGTGSNIIKVDPPDTTQIRFAGAQLDAGHTINSEAAGGVCVHIFTEGANALCAIVESGTWADGS